MFFLSKNPPLDFLIHCDAAWGGYFCTMIRDPKDKNKKVELSQEGFVPELPLSTFVKRQLDRLKDVDTITLDPHKSGFCVYPAGAIAYRKARINDVLSSMVEADTPYYYGSTNLGNWGIEGSKPGSSAAAVYMANRVRDKEETNGAQQTTHMAPVCCHVKMPLLPGINRFRNCRSKVLKLSIKIF